MKSKFYHIWGLTSQDDLWPPNIYWHAHRVHIHTIVHKLLCRNIKTNNGNKNENNFEPERSFCHLPTVMTMQGQKGAYKCSRWAGQCSCRVNIYTYAENLNFQLRKSTLLLRRAWKLDHSQTTWKREQLIWNCEYITKSWVSIRNIFVQGQSVLTTINEVSKHSVERPSNKNWF